MDLMKIAVWFDAEELAVLKRTLYHFAGGDRVSSRQLSEIRGLVDKVKAAEERMAGSVTTYDNGGPITSSRGITYHLPSGTDDH
jgi:hypothetical protein